MKTKIMSLVLIVLTTLFIMGCSGTTGATTASADTIKIPLDSITNQVQKFDYNTNGVTITYFAVLGSNGEVRTAFDACDVCGGKKGYSQQGNQVVCNNCGLKFSIDQLGQANKGSGCWPSHLEHEIEKGNVIIKTSEIEAGKFRFI